MYKTIVTFCKSTFLVGKLLANPYAVYQALAPMYVHPRYQIREGASNGGKDQIVILSDQLPEQDEWLQMSARLQTPIDVEIQEYPNPFLTGKMYEFDLVANPTWHSTAGKRLGITNPEQQIEWLRRKLEPAARLLRVQVKASYPISMPHKGSKITLAIAHFTGIMQVTDPDAAYTLLRNGIGRAKSMGCGLLLTRQIN